MTSITPVHRQVTPAIVTHSSTALRAPSSAAPPSAPRFPVAAPNASAIATIPVQSQLIAMFALPSSIFCFL